MMKKMMMVAFMLTLAWNTMAVLDWTVLDPNNPAALCSAHAINALPDGTMMLFAGNDEAQQPTNEYQKYSNNNWTEPVSPPNPPPARKGHASWVSGNKVYYHGGKGANQQTLNDLWYYDIDTDSWAQEQVTGSKPSPREGHLANKLADGTVIITGGKDCEGTPFKEAWLFNPSTKAFSILSVGPIPMANHIGQVVGDILWLFPPAGKVVCFKISTKEWTVADGGPDLLGGSTSALYKNEASETIIGIFGGVKYDGSESDVVYEYNVDQKKLSQRENKMPFPVAYSASSVISKPQYGGTILLFAGGISNGRTINKTFMFSSTGLYSISGTISGDVKEGVTVSLSGDASKSTTTAADGSYSFANLANGNYTVTPSLNGYTFNPTSIPVTINGANQPGKNFTATQKARTFCIMSGSRLKRPNFEGTGPWVCVKRLEKGAFAWPAWRSRTAI